MLKNSQYVELTIDRVYKDLKLALVLNEPEFLRGLKFPPFSRCNVAGKKRAGLSNPVKSLDLESCSNILFPSSVV